MYHFDAKIHFWAFQPTESLILYWKILEDNFKFESPTIKTTQKRILDENGSKPTFISFLKKYVTFESNVQDFNDTRSEACGGLWGEIGAKSHSVGPQWAIIFIVHFF